MASPTQNFTRRLYHGAGEPLSLATTLAAYGLAVATMLGASLLIGGDRTGVAASEVVGLGLVPLAIARVHEVPFAHLGLVRPRAHQVLGAVLCGLGLWLIALHAAAPVVRWTGRDAEVRSWATGLFADQPPLYTVLVTMVVVPAVCEELAHRGLLAGGLAPAIGRPLAIAVSTATFAALHLEPARMVATAILGAAAGVMAARGRSLWPAVALHATNNLVVVVLSRWPHLIRTIDRHVGIATAIAVACAVVGLAVAWIRPPIAPRPPASGTVAR